MSATDLPRCWADRPSAIAHGVMVPCDLLGEGRLGLCGEHERAIVPPRQP